MSLHPASTALHYGAEIFEGLKAYRRADGGVQLFRPMENVRRMNHSAARLCLPTINEQDMLQALTTFVEVEQDWTRTARGRRCISVRLCSETMRIWVYMPYTAQCLSSLPLQRQLLQRGHQPG